jgi:indole-3-glycerol phosphate synthase
MAELAKPALEDILGVRKRRLEEARARVPLERLQEVAEARSERRDFAGALVGGTLRVIAELKQASPSRGLLRRDYARRDIAQGYEAAGAAALSVLTEEDFFMGALSHLREAREVVRLPVLRKDFLVDAYQVVESVAWGADAVLLIVAALKNQALRELLKLCHEMRVVALVEVHTREELDWALAAGAHIIGVNNRNLKTLEVSLETSLRLKPMIPPHCLAVSESGIHTPADLHRLAEAGFNAALIGERLVVSPDPGRELAQLLEGVKALATSSSPGS